MIGHIEIVFVLSILHFYDTLAIVGQNNITFNNTYLTRLWSDIEILGNSTNFETPFDSGTLTACDTKIFNSIFTEQFKLNENYTTWVEGWNIESRVSKLYLHNYAFRDDTQPKRKVIKDVYSAENCILSCITSKQFKCRSVDYFLKDGGVCVFYDITGQLIANNPGYVSVHESSDHYIIKKDVSLEGNCTEAAEGQDLSFNPFALGWKAMEAGWWEMAQYLFQKAIDTDRNFYMAYVGKALSNDKMGYGIQDPVLGSYKDIINWISQQKDIDLRLSYQQRLFFKGLNAFLNSTNFGDGVNAMAGVFDSDQTTVQDYLISALKGYAHLLAYNSYVTLYSLARSQKNIWALHLLTHNLNPYKYPKTARSDDLRTAAVDAVFTFQLLVVPGSVTIVEDAVDIAEYFAEWALAKNVLYAQRSFLLKAVGSTSSQLLMKVGGDLKVIGTNVTYITVAKRLLNECERYHFHLLQLAEFSTAKSHLDRQASATNSNDPLLSAQLQRMTANAFFTSYDYIYNSYANSINFTQDWLQPVVKTPNPLLVSSRGYYWCAAAVQLLLANAQADINPITRAYNDALSNLKDFPRYADLVTMYKLMLESTKALVNNDLETAISKAAAVAQLQDVLARADFSVVGMDDISDYRLLIPIGYMFRADTLRYAYLRDKTSTTSPLVNISAVKDAYVLAIQTPPLNHSRALFGLGFALFEEYGNKEKRVDDAVPEYVRIWERLSKSWNATTDRIDSKNDINSKIDNYYKAEAKGCRAAVFEIRNGQDLCWGGYVVIGISVAFVVIIAIVIGILCLRKKAAAPPKDKEKEQSFIFSGPNLSRSDSPTASYNMNSLARTHDSMESSPYHNRTLETRSTATLYEQPSKKSGEFINAYSDRNS